MPYAFTGRAWLCKDTLNAYTLQAWTVYLGLSQHARCWKVSCRTLCVVSRARGNSEPRHVGLSYQPRLLYIAWSKLK